MSFNRTPHGEAIALIHQIDIVDRIVEGGYVLAARRVRAFASEYEITYRIGTADPIVLEEIFVLHTYDFTRWPWWARVQIPSRPLIVDAGSQIGASVMWFAGMLPGARIVAIEPDEGNYALLTRNLSSVPIDATALRRAVASHPGSFEVRDPGGGTWMYRTVRATGNAPLVAGITIAEILAAEDATPFVVKLDIEGAEAELLSANTAWIDAVPIIVIELHDRFVPGASRAWRAAMAGRDRLEVVDGDVVVSVRRDVLRGKGEGERGG